MGLFLPAYHACSLKHIQAISTKKKKALKTEDVVLAPIPNYPELSVDKLYAIFNEDAEVMSYLPDMGKKKCPKDYLW